MVETIIRNVFRSVTYILVAMVLFVLGSIVAPGFRFLFQPGFFTEFPRLGMTEGGIFPALVGSALMVLLVFLISVPLAILASIFLSEYLRGRFSSIFQSICSTMTAIPSIVYGLFGLVFYCVQLGLGTSLLTASLSLSTMTIPFIVTSTTEFLKAVPVDIREAAISLGATKFHVSLMVIRGAWKGMLTAILLGMGKSFGETAPILITGTVFYATQLPRSIHDPVMALPTTIYAIVVNLGERSQWMAQGTASLMVIFVVIIYSAIQIVRGVKKG